MGIIRLAATLGALLLGAAAAAADEPYAGKILTIYVGSSTGSGYDTTARLLARYIARHIPGHPQVIVRNMPGSGGMVMCNYVANVAPRDGLHLAAAYRTNAFEPLIGTVSTVKYDPLRLQWIGSANTDTSVAIATRRSGVRSWQDLKTRELVVAIAATGSGAERLVAPVVLRNLLGLKLKVIGGYPGAMEMNLAMMRGEVDGRGLFSMSSIKQYKQIKDDIDAGELVILYQMGLRKHPDIPHIPLVTDLAESEADKRMLEVLFTNLEMGRPYFVAEGVPASVVATLRRAFDAAATDKDLLADAAANQLEVNPMGGEEMQAILHRIYATPKAMIDRLLDMSRLPGEGGR